MENLKEKSNNEILMIIKDSQQRHEAKKIEILKHYDELLSIEKEFDEAGKILQNRLNTNVAK